MNYKVLGRAVHPTLGEGEIIAVDYFKNTLKIKFNEYEIYWLNKNHVKSDFNTKFDLYNPIVNNEIESTENFISRHLLEALRMGIVPIDYIESFTFGLEQELDEINNWLDSENGCVSLLGGYGEGKTHLINYIWKQKIENNWIVSKVEINNTDCSLSNPFSIFKEIMRNIRFYHNDKLCDYEVLFRILWEGDDELDPEWYLTKVIENYRKMYNGSYLFSDSEDKLLKYLIGKRDPGGNNFPKLNYQSGTTANIICNIICGLTYASDILGFNGLLILMDEGENLYYQKSYQKNLSLNSLSGLIALANQNTNLIEEEIIYISKKYKGSSTGLRYCGYNPNVKYAFSNELFNFNLKILISLIRSNPKLNNINLKELDIHTKKKMISSIITHYNNAYEMNLEENINDRILTHCDDENIRIFLKKVVSKLDYIQISQKYQ